MSLNRNKPMYQPWSETEFMSDEDVQHMDFYERSMYRTLLQSAFVCSTRPRLPYDDEKLRRLAGNPSKHLWDNHKQIVLNLFEIVEEGDKKYLTRKRLEIDWKREQNRRQMLSEKGLRGVEVKKAKAAGAVAVAEPELQLGFSTEQNRTEQNITEQTEQENMALSDKLKIMIFEYSGKVPRLPDYLVKEFRNRPGGERSNLNALRSYLHDMPGLEYPLHSFLDTEPEEIFQTPVVRGQVVDQEVLSLASKIFTICDLALSGKSLIAAKGLLEKYKEEEIIKAFRFFYSKLNDFYQKNSVRDFFEKGAAESVILSMREYVAHQEEIIKKAETVPVMPLGKPRSDEDEEEGIEIDF